MSFKRFLNQIQLELCFIFPLHRILQFILISLLYLLRQSAKNKVKQIITHSYQMEADDHGESFNQDVVGNIDEMTQAQRQAEFRRQHQEYIAIKLARKKQMVKNKVEEFGSSSSDDQDENCAASSSSKDSQLAQIQQSPMKSPQVPTKIISSQQDDPQSIIVPVFVKKGNEWVKQTINWKKNVTLLIQSYSYEIKNISKIKIIAQNAANCNFKIKLSYHQTEVIFAISEETEKQQLPLCYNVFARIIKERLAVAGWKLKDKTVQKIPGVPETLIKNSFIYGKIYKKSQVLGKWQERFIVINKIGIFSYKNFNEKHSIHINFGSVKQLWTRFEIQDQLLVIKIQHNSKKTQFGIPLYQFINQNSWLFNFYRMMGKTK